LTNNDKKIKKNNSNEATKVILFLDRVDNH
jgi:hypothetical protein